MAITIHLIVRYRELHFINPETEQRKLVLDTVGSMLKPCLYAALTTIAGFGSLLLCDILPVITFGWMMIGGITVSLILTFLFFPAALMLLHKGTPPTGRSQRFALTSFLAEFTEARGGLILAISGIIMIASAIGISRLVVENSFIDYFKDTTEIYQGMRVIDQKLGGTTSMDVIVDLVEPATSARTAALEADGDSDYKLDAFDEFDKTEDQDKYWFTSDKMAVVKKVHQYLESLPETGKVVSLATLLEIAQY
jgi:predicted RND superfamily exporter protein